VKRGDFVTAAFSGDYGKPRPALVVQSNAFMSHPSIILCPLTTTLRDDTDEFRITVYPASQNGLWKPSQIAIDKMTVLPCDRLGEVIGQADEELMLHVNRAIAIFLAIT
jgi:mRNA interferase MazF